MNELSRILRVFLDESKNECCSSAVCEHICPEVFKVPTWKMEVQKEIDPNKYRAKVIEAAESCPLEVIAVVTDSTSQTE